MRRVNVFIASLLTSTIALLALIIIGFNLFASQQYPSGWMGGMMGQNGATQATSSSASFLWALFASIAAISIISIIGLVYYLAYPQIKLGTAKPTIASAINQSANTASPYESIEKTLTNEERKVINVLNAH
jgi:predicted lipid-binding transport protein (Tim44 family)